MAKKGKNPKRRGLTWEKLSESLSDCRKWLGRGGYFTLNYLYIRHLQQLQIKTMILNVKDQKVCRIFAIFNQFPITEFWIIWLGQLWKNTSANFNKDEFDWHERVKVYFKYYSSLNNKSTLFYTAALFTQLATNWVGQERILGMLIVIT